MSGRAVPAEGVGAGMRVWRVDVSFLWQLFAQALTYLLCCRSVVTARRYSQQALLPKL